MKNISAPYDAKFSVLPFGYRVQNEKPGNHGKSLFFGFIKLK